MDYFLKLKKITYYLICKIYRDIFKSYYRIKYPNTKYLSNNSYTKYIKEGKIEEIININNCEKVLKTDYQDIFILDANDINKIVNKIIDPNLREFISKKTNLKYSVDFILFYKNKHLDKELEKKSIYANKMHIDKPFSPFTLKIFIPINVFSDKNGPLEVKIKNSNNFKSNNYNEKEFEKFYSSNISSNLYLFYPSQSYHRACIPSKGFSSINLLLQLNPNKHWSISRNLYQKQYSIEPSFPEIRNINSKRIFMKY